VTDRPFIPDSIVIGDLGWRTYEHEVGRGVADAAERVAEEVGEEAELAAAGPHLAGAL
jgi:hypothetical protein